MRSPSGKTAQEDAAIPPLSPMAPSGGSTPVHVPARRLEYTKIRRNSEMTPKEQLDLYTTAYKQAGEPAVKEAAGLDPMAMRQAIAAVYGETLGDMNDPKALQRKWNVVLRGRNARKIMQAYNNALMGKPAPAKDGGSNIANMRPRSEIYNPPANTPSGSAKPVVPRFQTNAIGQAAAGQMANIQAANQLARQQSAQAKSQADTIGRAANIGMLFRKPEPKRIVRQSPDTARRNAEWMANRQAQKAQQAVAARQNARYAQFGLGPGRANTPNNQIAGK